MKTAARYRLFFAVTLAVLRVATAGQQAHRGFLKFSTALRIKAAPSRRDQSQAAAPAAASPAKDAGSTDIEKAAKGLTPPKTVFKMPDYRHADSLSAATNGYLDWFVVIYWGSVILVLLVVEAVAHLRGDASAAQAQSENPEEVEASAKKPKKTTKPTPREEPEFMSATLGTRSSLQRSSLQRASTSSILLGPDDDPGRSKDLAPNVWALNLVASRGKAHDQRGNKLSPKLVFMAGVAMGILQLLTLFLVVYDIDPSATPYTEKPSAPWKKSPLTVNCMKVVMVFFLGMYVVSEAADAYDSYLIAMALKVEELLVHRFFVLFTPMFHYLVTLSVILAGVSVVLSCQDVPNILYNSMAILFITRVDELFWGFFERTFDIEAEWAVNINESETAEVQLLKKCIILFPMAWGFCLLGRAWYRDQMPTVRVHLDS